MKNDDKFRIGAEIKIFNDSLVQAIQKAGFNSLKEFSDTTKINYQHILNLKQMRVMPNQRDKEIFKKFLGDLSQNLFPDKELYDLLKNKPRKIRSSAIATKLIGTYEQKEHLRLARITSPEQRFMNKSVSETLQRVIDETLSAREKKIIYERFVNGKDLESVGAMFDVTRTRISEIQAKALSKMRKNPRMKDLKYALEEGGLYG